MRQFYLTAACAALLAACVQSEPDNELTTADEMPAASVTPDAGGDALANDEERTFYALGLVLGENVAQFDLTEREMEVVQMGMSDTLSDEPYQVDLQEFGPRIQQLADQRTMARAEEERAAAATFAAEVAGEPGAERTASGLVYVPLEEGEGESPEATDTVLVHYHGTLRDGSVFDSSVERGDPIELELDRVIPCWTEGLPMMKVGGKAKLLCPSDIAYGDQGTPGIPGGAALLFEIELIEIVEEPEA
jgi:FKBP-type peptidyl-prolyl cis-trans isomerase FkpA